MLFVNRINFQTMRTISWYQSSGTLVLIEAVSGPHLAVNWGCFSATRGVFAFCGCSWLLLQKAVSWATAYIRTMKTWFFLWRMHFNCRAWRQAWTWKQPFQEKRVPLFVAESFCAPIFKWVSLTPKEMKIYTCFKSRNRAKEWMLGWMQNKMIGVVFCYVFLLFSFPPVWKVINTYGFRLIQTTNADKENVRSWS